MRYFKIISNYVLLSLLASTMSCKDSIIEKYTGDSYINFTKESKDSTLFSFANEATLTESTIGLELSIASEVVENNRTYIVRFLSDESSAKEGVHFEKVTEINTFKGGLAVDSLFIKVKKTTDLSKSIVTAVFEIIDGGDFKRGFKSNIKARLMITNMLTKPQWWNVWHESDGLGIYSEKKYRKFIQITGEYDLDYQNREDMDYTTMRALVLKFKYHLLDNPEKEEDGSTMTVPING